MSTLGVREVRAKLEVHCPYLLPVAPEESFFSDKEHAPREAGRLVPSRRHTSPSLLRVWSINQRDSVLDCGGRDARRKPASATPLSPESRSSFEPSALKRLPHSLRSISASISAKSQDLARQQTAARPAAAEKKPASSHSQPRIPVTHQLNFRRQFAIPLFAPLLNFSRPKPQHPAGLFECPCRRNQHKAKPADNNDAKHKRK